MPLDRGENPEITAQIKAENQAKKVIEDATRQIVQYRTNIVQASLKVNEVTKSTGAIHKQVAKQVKDAQDLTTEAVANYNKELERTQNILDRVNQQEGKRLKQMQGSARLQNAAAATTVVHGVVGVGASAAKHVGAIMLAQSAHPFKALAKAEEDLADKQKKLVGPMKETEKAAFLMNKTIRHSYENVLKGFVGQIELVGKALRMGLVPAFKMVGKVAYEALVPLLPYLLPIVVTIVAVVAVFKTLQLLYKAFKRDIDHFIYQTINPFRLAWIHFTLEAREKLLPLLATLGIIFAAVGKVIQIVMLHVILPVFKLGLNIIIGVLDVVNKAFMMTMDAIMDIAQPVVDFFVKWVNEIRLVWAAFSNNHLTMKERFKIVLGAMIDHVMDMYEAIVKLFLELGKWLIKWPADMGVMLLKAFSDYVMAPLVHLFEQLSKDIEGVFLNIVNGILHAINTMIDKLKSLPLMPAWVKNFQDFSDLQANVQVQTTEQIQAQYNALYDSIQKTIDSTLDSAVNTTMDSITTVMNEIKAKFGIDLQSLADTAGIQLFNSPDLKEQFHKLIDLAVPQLRTALDNMTGSIDQINARDASIEINPIITVNISKDVDSATLEAKIYAAIDQAIQDGVKNIPQNVFQVNI